MATHNRNEQLFHFLQSSLELGLSSILRVFHSY